MQKKNVFLINSRRDGSCVILSASRQIRRDHEESSGIFSLREKKTHVARETARQGDVLLLTWLLDDGVLKPCQPLT